MWWKLFAGVDIGLHVDSQFIKRCNIMWTRRNLRWGNPHLSMHAFSCFFVFFFVFFLWGGVTEIWISHIARHLYPSVFNFHLLQVNDLIISTVDTVRQKFFLDTYVSHNKALLFVGPTGTGKSAITNNYLVQLPKEKWVYMLNHAWYNKASFKEILKCGPKLPVLTSILQLLPLKNLQSVTCMIHWS